MNKISLGLALKQSGEWEMNEGIDQVRLAKIGAVGW